MKTTIPLVIVLLLLVPNVAVGARETPVFPADLGVVVAQWVENAEDSAVGFEDREWYPQAKDFLDKARVAQQEGRLRVAMFDLETFDELLRTGQLMDEASQRTSDADRKTLVAERTKAWHADALIAWDAYREASHAFDGELHSLRSVERTLYAGDMALAGRMAIEEFDRISKEFPKQPTFERGFVLALVHASSTGLLNIAWARDVLDTAAALEGLQPRILDVPLANLTKAALVDVGDPAALPPYLQGYAKVGKPVRDNGEGLLATAVYLAELRAARISGILVIFGDAQSRGKDVVADAARNMGRQLNNTTMAAPQGVGLEGVFTADAMDRAAFALEFAARQQIDLGTIVTSWAALDHAGYVTGALGKASPIQPPPVTAEGGGNKTPLSVAVVLVGLGAAVVLVALARRK